MKKYLHRASIYIICFLGSVMLAYGQNKSLDTLTIDNKLSKKHIENDSLIFVSDSLRIAPPRTTSRVPKAGEYLLLGEENRMQSKNSSSSTSSTQSSTSSTTTQVLITDYLVGATNGNANVTPSGAGTYTIPLELPVGINGMQPNVSIYYNSQSPNGLLGYAWNLSAYSVISRTGKTFYHDGTTDAVRLNSTDNLMLDGQRLMLFSGINFIHGAKYRTEIETFNDVSYKSNTPLPNFEVQTKDGLIMQYGTTVDSRFEAQGGVVLCWLLKRVTDTNGNYMTYSYEKDNATGEIYIKSIEYAGNSQAGITPVNKIEFIYDDRDDEIKSFIAGNRLSTTKILKSIKITTSNTLFREYKFSYYYDGFYNKLTEIIESTGSANNQRYNSTIIEWGADRDMLSYGGFEKRMNPINSFDQQKRLYADFNGDGKMDFISFEKKDLDQYTSSDYAKLYINQSFPSYYFTGCQISLGAKFCDMKAGDFNGDGLMDVVKINQDPNNSNNYKYTIFLFNGNAFVESYNFNSTSKECLVADFDGDGKADIHAGTILWRDGVSPVSVGVAVTEYIHLGDFTGNGKMNLLRLTTTGYEIYEFNGNNFSTIQSGTVLKNSDMPIIGDFNGDGITDILVRKSNYTEYFILFGTGTGFQQETLPNLNITGRCFVGDFNRDGKSDIIFADHNSRTGQTYPVRIGLFDGNNFQFSNYLNVIPDATVHCTLYPAVCNAEMDYMWGSGRIIIIDLDGDGRSELLYDDHRPTDNIISFPDNQNLFVNNITDGLNRKTSFVFSTIATDELNGYNQTASYKKNNNTVKRGAAIPLPVLTVLLTEAGGIADTTEFEFGKMVRHSHGKGFLCFEEITVYNFGENRRRTVTEYAWHPIHYNSYLTTEKTFTLSEQLITTNYYNNLVNWILGSGTIIYPYINMHSTTDHLTGLSATTSFTVDGNGNTTFINKTAGGLNTTTSIQYVQKGSWLPNKPVNVSVTNTLSGESQTRVTTYDYDNKGNLTKETTDPGDQNSLVVEYKDFNTFGHPLTIETKADAKTRTATYQYTPSGRFLSTKTDVLGEKTTYRWTETKGTLLDKTDNSGYTQYHYDAMGRITTISDPSQQNGPPAKNITYHWENDGDKLYYIQEEIGTLDPVRTYYNAAGQEILHESYGLNSQKISRFTEYFSNGKVKRVSAPTFDSSPVEWDAAYTYDNIGRIASVTTLDGTTTYAYNGLTTTVTSPTETRTTTLNNVGEPITSTVNGKSVSYQYYPSRLLKSSTPEGGQSIQLEYDLQGNRTKITDPDAGVIHSRYDGFGQLRRTSQQVHLGTADSIITTNIYADNGLLLSINRNNGNNNETTVYTYDNKNRVDTIKIANQHKQIFTYDNRNRITNIKEKIDGNVYETSTTYDNLDRSVRKTFPSGYYTENHYDNSGLLFKVTDNSNKLVWQAEEENARGQILHETRGNKATFHNYNNKGLLTRSYSDLIFDLSYEYDSKNNLSRRSDQLRALKEDFSYDTLNRLTSWDISQHDSLLQSNSIAYDALGRITGKNDVGYSDMLYGEGNNKPHALTSNAFEDEAPSELFASYTDFKKPATLTEGDKFYVLTYGVDDQRRKSEYTENDTLRQTRYYMGNYEEKIDKISGETEKIHYLYGGGVYMERIPLAGDTTKLFYFAYTDHLGSLIALTDYDGEEVERYAYDPWGNRRNPDNWEEKDERTTWLLNRGFTGHEHIDEFGIINMNGRVYCPLTAQFYSPDPYVQAPKNWLNYNRYSYCWNNPLRYTDPSGEWVDTSNGSASVPGLGSDDGRGVTSLSGSGNSNNYYGIYPSFVYTGVTSFGSQSIFVGSQPNYMMGVNEEGIISSDVKRIWNFYIDANGRIFNSAEYTDGFIIGERGEVVELTTLLNPSVAFGAKSGRVYDQNYGDVFLNPDPYGMGSGLGATSKYIGANPIIFGGFGFRTNCARSQTWQQNLYDLSSDISSVLVWALEPLFNSSAQVPTIQSPAPSSNDRAVYLHPKSQHVVDVHMKTISQKQKDSLRAIGKERKNPETGINTYIFQIP